MIIQCMLKYCLYLKLGLKVKKSHKIIQFDQKNWMRKYVDFNTKKRKEANNEFDKNIYKLKNNSVFGKTCENLRQRKKITIVNSNQKAKKIITKSTYKNHVCISENLVISTEKQKEIYFNKPIYVGTTILDYAKYIMYDFYYVLKPFYGNKITLCYTDTDSFVLEIQTDDVYQDIIDNFFRLL